MLKKLWHQRELIIQLTKRDVLSRYRGSLLGLFWSFLTPLLLLAVYTFVFGYVFEARWGTDIQNKGEFALVLFAGLTAFNIFAESIGRAPGCIIGNPNYIKRVVFPLEILPVTVLGSALVNGAISIGTVLFAKLILDGTLHATALLLPIVLFPLILLTLGLCWFLASLGVYLRDIGQAIPVLVMSLMFMSPIFYPVSAIPEKFLIIYKLNPLGYILEDSRRVLLWGQAPHWGHIAILTGVSFIVASLGFYWFERTRKGFADVV